MSSKVHEADMSWVNVSIPSDDEVENLSLTVYRRRLEAYKYIDVILRAWAKMLQRAARVASEFRSGDGVR